jgi:hypothetical protein
MTLGDVAQYLALAAERLEAIRAALDGEDDDAPFEDDLDRIVRALDLTAKAIADVNVWLDEVETDRVRQYFRSRKEKP